jgi:hypothetical protein
MKNENNKTAKPASTGTNTGTNAADDDWNPYDEYDCRLNEPKQTAEYIAFTTPPGVKEAIARRQAELKAARLAAGPEAVPKKS